MLGVFVKLLGKLVCNHINKRVLPARVLLFGQSFTSSATSRSSQHPQHPSSRKRQSQRGKSLNSLGEINSGDERSTRGDTGKGCASADPSLHCRRSASLAAGSWICLPGPVLHHCESCGTPISTNTNTKASAGPLHCFHCKMLRLSSGGCGGCKDASAFALLPLYPTTVPRLGSIMSM